jgi:hypothetical protein
MPGEGSATTPQRIQTQPFLVAHCPPTKFVDLRIWPGNAEHQFQVRSWHQDGVSCGIVRRRGNMADKEATERRVYVLPREQLERIRAYQSNSAIGSEVDAVRPLLDSALQMRDTPQDILRKLKSRFADEKDLRVLARDILAAVDPGRQAAGTSARDEAILKRPVPDHTMRARTGSRILSILPSRTAPASPPSPIVRACETRFIVVTSAPSARAASA